MTTKRTLVHHMFVVKVNYLRLGNWISVRSFRDKRSALEYMKDAGETDPQDELKLFEVCTYEKALPERARRTK